MKKNKNDYDVVLIVKTTNETKAYWVIDVDKPN